MLNKREKSKTIAAIKAGMDPKTGLKYRKIGKLPSQIKKAHQWRTRADVFDQDWGRIKDMLEISPGLEAKTIFEYLQGENPGRYQDGQLRTLQRRIKRWRATEGPVKEVYFPQKHIPGKLSSSDFTHMTKLGITINGELFDHLVYHFVLTYSNWETGSICFSENFESLSAGLQNAFWELGGVTARHRTDRMSAAVNKDCNPDKFSQRYASLLRHYNVVPERTNAGSPHENGDIEQSHRRFKQAVDQALMLRGSRDFNNQKEYESFLSKVLQQKNAGREQRLEEELKVLKSLPATRTNDYTREEKTVAPSSTINVRNNTYSVHSRLIGERVQIRQYVDHLEIWYAQQIVDRLPRLRGRGKHRINYRHIIDWLERKPGAFANYRYKADIFPSSYFRMAYDQLNNQCPTNADKEYLRILKISAKEGESLTQTIIQQLLSAGQPLNADVVQQHIQNKINVKPMTVVTIAPVELEEYDALLEEVTYG